MPILGDFPPCGLHASFVESHDMFLDCRGYLKIEDHVRFGYGVKILTASHNPNDMPLKRPFPTMEIRAVVIHRLAWICSFSLLYNCEIGEGAIVGSGAVVKGVMVPSWSWVEGNPAVIVGYFDHEQGKWFRILLPRPIPLINEEFKNETRAKRIVAKPPDPGE